MGTFIVTFIAFALVMTALGAGTILSRGEKCLRGTCGGDEVVGPNGEDLLCDACPRRKNNECPGDGECDGRDEREHHAA